MATVRTSPDGPAFSAEEYDRRLDRVRARMGERDVDVLVLCNPANINYLCGYDAWSFYVHQALIVGRDRAAPLWIGRASDIHGVRFTTHLPEGHAIGYPEACIESTTYHAMRFMGEHLCAQGYGRARIGVEMEAYYYTARAHAALCRSVPEASVVDVTDLVNFVRIVKSDAELRYLREAAQIADLAMARAVDAIGPGVRQNEVASIISRTQIEGTSEFGGDYPAIVPLLPSGTRSGAPHLTWSDREFQPGEGTIIELAGCRRRYHCPLARTVFLGPAPGPVRDTARVVRDGVARALEAARPGAVAQDVESAWRRSVSRSGVVKESRLGYSIGINYPPDWGEHSASLRPGDHTELQENMTFHLMPGLWYEDWGIELSQPFRVTRSGAEPLTAFPLELVVKT